MFLVVTFLSCLSFLGPLCQEPEQTTRISAETDIKQFSRKDKLKIGFVVNQLNDGGVARVSQVVSEQLTAYGHQVVLITGNKNENDFQIAPNVQRVVLTQFSRQLYQMTDIKALNLDVIVFQEYWTDENYHLISEYVDAGMKVIALHHNVYIWQHISSPRALRSTQSTTNVARLLHMHYPRAHAVIALSPFDAVIFKRIGCHSRFIPNPSSFQMRDISQKPKNQILFVGRMSPEKQPDMALDMMTEMALLNKKAKLMMVGDNEESVNQRIKKENIKNVKAVGYKANVNVNDYYDNAAVFILTSKFEGYPMVVTEAISHGLPVVAFELPYLALMECNVTQVPKKDVKEMAKKVNELLQDEELRQRVAKDAQRCVERLNAQVVPRWNDLLDKIVNEYEVDYADEVGEKWVDEVLQSELKSAK